MVTLLLVSLIIILLYKYEPGRVDYVIGRIRGAIKKLAVYLVNKVKGDK